jgi:ATP-binding protein involved in chromosome partitioning
MSALTPVGIDLQDTQDRIKVSWSDGSDSVIPYRELRLKCRCAVCVDEMTGKPLLDPKTVPLGIGVANCQEVGLYGIQISWTDGHSTGIYTWARIQEIASASDA